MTATDVRRDKTTQQGDVSLEASAVNLSLGVINPGVTAPLAL